MSNRSPHSREVRLLRVARGRIAGEPGRDDEVRARSQELEAGLVADLHAAAGQQRDAPAQIGQLAALREIEVAARRRTDGRRNDEWSSTSACRCSNAAGRSSRAGRHRLRPSPLRQARGRSAETRCGAKTFGVVNTGCRRKARIPVPASTPSSRSDRSRFRRRASAFAIVRRARTSGLHTRAAASRRRRCSSSESTARVPRSAAIDSSVSVAARRRSRSSGFSGRRRSRGGHAPQG